MADDVKPGPAPSTGELESIQSAAKWLVGAAAAVMALLLAGLQLPVVLRVTADSVAVWGVPVAWGIALVAILAVGFVLVSAARVLVHPGWSLTKLSQLDDPLTVDPLKNKWNDHWLKDELEGQRALLAPGDELRPSTLSRQGHNLLTAWDTLHKTGSATVADDAPPRRTYTQGVQADEDALESRYRNSLEINQRVADAANLADVRRRYRRLVRGLPIAGILIIGAFGGLVWLLAASGDQL